MHRSGVSFFSEVDEKVMVRGESAFLARMDSN
jgi:hypothetical protein